MNLWELFQGIVYSLDHASGPPYPYFKDLPLNIGNKVDFHFLPQGDLTKSNIMIKEGYFPITVDGSLLSQTEDALCGCVERRQCKGTEQ